MTIEDDGGWDAAEGEALRALARDVPVPAGAEDRAVAALRRSAVIRGPRRWRWVGAAASVAAAFAGGLAVGRHPAPAAEDPRPQFVVLLYGAATPDPAEEQRHTGEIAAWARGLVERGNALSGAKLNEHEYTLGTGAGGSTADLGGYIVLAASGVEEAMEMARSCPHLRHGGRIVVRAVDPT